MFKTTSKLLGLFLLLLLSFVYTDKVFSSARQSDPVMKEITNFKKKNDTKAVEPIIRDDEMILGYSGLIVNEKDSYKNMKEASKFDKEKIVYETKLPNNTISKTYDYYIRQGNPKNKNVSIIFKITDNTNLDSLLSKLSNKNIKLNFFVDGAWLEENVDKAFEMVNYGSEIYNLGYDGVYKKQMISVTNNLIESITLKDALFCLNENKDDSSKKLCKKKKMHTIIPTVSNPSILDLKTNLDKGIIISYDLSIYDISSFNLMINSIESRGYTIDGLSKVINESN